MLDLTRGRPEAVKTVLASVVLVLAAYQIALITVGYGKVRLPFLAGRSASRAHRASGDAIAVLIVLVAAGCTALYGFEDEHLLHGLSGAALVGLLAAKVAVVRRGLGLSRALPLFGTGVFLLIALTWATAAPEHL